MNVTTRQITVGFRSSEDLVKAEAALESQGVADFETEAPVTLGNNVPQKRRPDSQSGLPYAISVGALSGALLGAFISTMALNVPNLPSVEGSTTEMYVLVPLGGALLGAIAAGLMALLSGANPEDPDFAYFKLRAEADSVEKAQAITDTLIEAGGRLL